MAASNEQIRQVVEQYVALVAKDPAAIPELYAEGATLEDPVGSEVRTTRAQIAEFYGALVGLDIETRLVEARVVAGEAVFCFELVTTVGDDRYRLAPFDHMVFDDEGRIRSMRAFWSETDMGTA